MNEENCNATNAPGGERRSENADTQGGKVNEAFLGLRDVRGATNTDVTSAVDVDFDDLPGDVAHPPAQLCQVARAAHGRAGLRQHQRRADACPTHPRLVAEPAAANNAFRP
eukprot:6176405-Pleurochrysis_carterae.AAC.2